MTQSPVAPDHDDQVQLILEYHEKGMYDKVRQICRALLEAGAPDCRLIALQYLGLSYYQERSYSDALPYFQKVAEEGGDTQDLFNLLMVAVYDRQRFVEDKALSRLVPLLRDPPPDSISEGFVRFHYGRALDDMKRPGDARRQFEVLLVEYGALPSQEDRVCAAHGLPRFSEFLRAAEEVFGNLGEEEEDAFRAWVAGGLARGRIH